MGRPWPCLKGRYRYRPRHRRGIQLRQRRPERIEAQRAGTDHRRAPYALPPSTPIALVLARGPGTAINFRTDPQVFAAVRRALEAAGIVSSPRTAAPWRAAERPAMNDYYLRVNISGDDYRIRIAPAAQSPRLTPPVPKEETSRRASPFPEAWRGLFEWTHRVLSLRVSRNRVHFVGILR
jgi:hypothetical protein